MWRIKYKVFKRAKEECKSYYIYLSYVQQTDKDYLYRNNAILLFLSRKLASFKGSQLATFRP